MAVLEILRKGHVALKTKSEEIKEINSEVKKIIKDVKDTLYDSTGIGLAAPQIGINKRIILIDLRDGMDPILLINPRIVKKSGKIESEEGCLSYPGYFGYVERPKKVEVEGITEDGKVVRYKADGLLGRAFCHEIDHLDGIMYTDIAYELYKEEE